MQFFRTVGGKLLAFFLCILFFTMAVGAGVGAIVMLEGSFYTRTEAEIFDDVIQEPLISTGDDIILEAIHAHFPKIMGDRGNLAFQVYDEHGAVLTTSKWLADHADREKTLYAEAFWVFEDENYIDIVSDYYFNTYNPEPGYVCYTIHFALLPGFPETDLYSLLSALIHVGYRLRFWVYPIFLVSLALAVSLFVLLMCVSARRPHTDALHPGIAHRVPFDLLLAVCIFMGIVLVMAWGTAANDYQLLVFGLPLCFLLASMGLGLSMSIAARLKTQTLLRNTVIYRVLRFTWRSARWLWRQLGKLPLVWRTATLLLGITLLELFMLSFNSVATTVFFWFMEKLLLIPAVLYVAICLRRLQKGGEALASGNLSYQTDDRGLIWDFQRHAKNLNSIALGMNAAVEERLKSEHMKTELITNVSHDLKTPLTSIINYADLIAKEPCENAKITEYADVLTRQSDRLKHLIEDLVEASKASTGNLEVNLAPCDAAVFLTQAAGEYEKRLADAQLQLVVKCPEEPIRILADGRRMWRIFDNLMNNICKYAQPGTRVYLSLETMVDSAVITFKNTSRQQLDMTEEELMERFVRGDTSRNTEGNGLGLSIARSMAELQRGSLRLFIDGDLFKAILVFPKFIDTALPS